jgi:ketosteroid isomerase-like protein
MPRMTRRLLIAICSITLAVSGCGSEKQSEESKVEDTVVEYYKAFGSGDGETACNHLAEKTREQLEKAGGGESCPEVLEAALDRPEYAKVAKQLESVKVSGVEVSGDTAIATALLPDIKAADGKTPISTSVPLAKEEGTWKIASPLGQA